MKMVCVRVRATWLGLDDGRVDGSELGCSGACMFESRPQT